MSATSLSGDGLSSDWCIAATSARATCHQFSPRNAFGQLRRHGPQGQNSPRTQCVSYQYTPNNTPNDVLCHFNPLSRAVSHCSIAQAERHAGADVTLCSRYQSQISYPCSTAALQNPPPHEHMAAKALKSNALHLGPEILAVRGKKEKNFLVNFTVASEHKNAWGSRLSLVKYSGKSSRERSCCHISPSGAIVWFLCMCVCGRL